MGEHGWVPFPARRAIQKAIWEDCIQPADNEWTTWTDAIALAEVAATALVRNGWKVVPADHDTVGASVHVSGGRRQHIARTDRLTYCGQAWVATNVGPPATERPVCPICKQNRTTEATA